MIIKRGFLPKKAQTKPSSKILGILPVVFIMAILFLAILDYKGYIDLSDFGSKLFGKDQEFKGVPIVCPLYSNQTDHPCCTVSGTGEIKPAVSAIYIPASCKCPQDTKYLQMAPEGDGKTYQICNCTECKRD